jgi:MATE family multidrug resistance protein
MTPRRSSINAELLRHRFSSSSAEGVAAACNNNIRTSSQLDAVSESESLLPVATANDENDKNNTHFYGSVAEIEPPHSSDIDEEEALQTQQQQQYHRRLSLTKDSKLLQDEMKSMIELALPVCLTYLLEMLPGITTIILVGRMKEEDGNKLHIDATALAVMFVNITGMSTGLGLLTAMDTLCSHAHGANQPSKMGTYLLTGMFVMMITFVIVGVVIWNTTPILLVCGQHSNVAMEAGSFAQYMLPSVPFVYAYEILRKISQARNEATPMMVSAIVSNIVNIGLGYYLVNCTAWGWLGAAVAKSVGSFVMLPTLILSMMYCERGEAMKASNNDDEEKNNTNEEEVMDGQLFHHLWEGFQPSQALTFKAIVKFLDLGLPGMLQLMFEWVAFEVIALLCGIIPNQEEALIAIGSNAIVLNVSSFAFMLYLGAGVAGNVRIGNALGAGDAHRAEVATYLAVAIGTLLSLVNIALIVTFRENLASIFTNDEDLLNKCRSLFIIVALFQLPDAINGVEQGVFRASGRQSLSAKLNFVAYYVIGIPLGYYLAIPLRMGVEGLWIGMSAGLVAISSTNSIVIMRSDWAALATAARSRLSVVLPSKEMS